MSCHLETAISKPLSVIEFLCFCTPIVTPMIVGRGLRCAMICQFWFAILDDMYISWKIIPRPDEFKSCFPHAELLRN